MGLVELAIQFITKDGTSRTTKTRSGWTPLIETLRAISEIPHPYTSQTDKARGEVPKLVEFAKMLIDDKRIDLNLLVVDEVLFLTRDNDWDDYGNGHTALSLCLQGTDRYNPALVDAILKSPAVQIDGVALLTLVKYQSWTQLSDFLSRFVYGF